MKNNLGMFFGLSRWSVGVVLLALFAFVPLSRANISIVNNTGNVLNGSSANLPLAQEFTMPTSGVLGSTTVTISSLTLTLGGTGTAEVYVYADTSGSGPNNAYNGAGNALYDLGSVSSSGVVSLTSPSSDVLSASGAYSIVLGTGSSLSWNYTSDSSNPGGNATMGGDYLFFGGAWHLQSGDYFQMNLAAVPEVPMTGAVMGFGVLAFAVGRTLRRRICAASANRIV